MKESNISLQLRLRETTHKKLKYIASTELRSLNGQIEYFLLQEIAQYEQKFGEISVDEY